MMKRMIQRLLLYTARVLRCLYIYVTAFAVRFIYNKPEELPPLRNKILLHPATVLAEKIRKKQLKSVDLVEAFIARAKDVQPYINAIVDEQFDDAVAEAKRVDNFIASGTKSEEEIKRDTPLLGVPFSCKEYIAVKGLYFTNGLYSRRGIRADFDADVVKKMKSAGAILVVKTNVPELSCSWDCGNHVYGTTKNPYDTRRIPGGSSGGEGALIASGASIIGLGSDLGGSLRLPAFMNGIFCHKPTAGIIPDVGTYPPLPPNIANFYSNIGPMCRYASDLRPMMKILTAPGKLDLEKQVDLSNLKIYYSEDDGGNPFTTPVQRDIRATLKHAVKHFEDKYGVPAKKVHLKELKEGVVMWFHVLSEAGFPPISDAMTDGKGRFNRPWELFKWCIGASRHTATVLNSELLQTLFSSKNPEAHKTMLKKFEQLRKQFDEMFKEHCVFLYPTQPEVAPYLHETIAKFFNVGYTCVFNLLGFPVSHCPLGLSRGLPIGIQVVANTLEDNLTMTVAEELERAFGGWSCPTPVL